jgi:hypothetical protein
VCRVRPSILCTWLNADENGTLGTGLANSPTHVCAHVRVCACARVARSWKIGVPSVPNSQPLIGVQQTGWTKRASRIREPTFRPTICTILPHPRFRVDWAVIRAHQRRARSVKSVRQKWERSHLTCTAMKHLKKPAKPAFIRLWSARAASGKGVMASKKVGSEKIESS